MAHLLATHFRPFRGVEKPYQEKTGEGDHNVRVQDLRITFMVAVCRGGAEVHLL
jgi:hypothetical protein